MEYMYDQLFDSQGHTGKIYYFRLIDSHDGMIWDNTNSEMVILPSWEDSVISLTEKGETGQFPVVIPNGLPGGVYAIVVYEQEGSAPANTDDVVKQISQVKHGGVFGF